MARNDVDLILAVGGGSTVDYAKAVSVSAGATRTRGRSFHFARLEEPENRIIPVGSVLTMTGTGSR